MDVELNDLLDRLHKLEEEFEEKLETQRASFRYQLQKGRVVFEKSALAEHRRIRKSVIRFLRESNIGALLIVPFVYALVVPFIALDLGVWLCQRVCFSVWGIDLVRRADYIRLDKSHLAYLNSIEKLNCVYCSYANGLVAFVREVAARSEQYWCPIKHAVRTQSTHSRYRRFVDYGDAEGFRARLEQFRDDVRKSHSDDYPIPAAPAISDARRRCARSGRWFGGRFEVPRQTAWRHCHRRW